MITVLLLPTVGVLSILAIVQGMLLRNSQKKRKTRIQELGVDLSEEVQRIYTAINEINVVRDQDRQRALRKHQDLCRIISDLNKRIDRQMVCKRSR